ncbi:unnamed protein product, partial [Heterosigma akashiwo]
MSQRLFRENARASFVVPNVMGQKNLAVVSNNLFQASQPFPLVVLLIKRKMEMPKPV